MSALLTMTAGRLCAESLAEVGVMQLPAGCWDGLRELCTGLLVLTAFVAVKAPSIYRIWRNDLPGWPESGARCCCEFFVMLFSLVCHIQLEHPLSFYWEEVFLMSYTLLYIGVWFVKMDIFEDEMNSFGGMAVLGCFVWMLFIIDFDGPQSRWLQIFAMVFLLCRDGFAIRYGPLDGRTATHAVYLVAAALRCHGSMQRSLGVRWQPGDDWASARHGVGFLLALVLVVEAHLSVSFEERRKHMETKELTHSAKVKAIEAQYAEAKRRREAKLK